VSVVFLLFWQQKMAALEYIAGESFVIKEVDYLTATSVPSLLTVDLDLLGWPKIRCIIFGMPCIPGLEAFDEHRSTLLGMLDVIIEDALGIYSKLREYSTIEFHVGSSTSAVCVLRVCGLRNNKLSHVMNLGLLKTLSGMASQPPAERPEPVVAPAVEPFSPWCSIL
jgi:hypothetical protein